MKEYRENSLIFYRLVALWILCEAMLGGIIHGFRIPVSGLVVGSSAVICIALIAWYLPGKGNILKATIIVAVFKMMLSPQAPIPAYIAVFFQGLLGEALFWRRRYFALSCIALSVLALLESGLQRILVLTIVYGNDLWKVINDFFNGLSGRKTNTNYSLILGGAYVALHLVTGIIIGFFAAMLPKRIARWSGNKELLFTGEELEEVKELSLPKKKKRRRILFLVTWFLLLLLYLQSNIPVGRPLLPSSVPLRIFIRSAIIVFGWMFLAGPLLQKLLHQWLKQKRTKLQDEVNAILELLPLMRSVVLRSWQRSAINNGRHKLVYFTKLVLVNTVIVPETTAEGWFILAGPIRSGKTSSLLRWSDKRNDVHGVLSPDIDGKRFFYDLETRQPFRMEALGGEQDVLSVGKFVFSAAAFKKAEDIILRSISTPGWLVIDEIGPMELRGEGFHRVLKQVVSKRKGRTLLVVRLGMEENVIKEFGIHARVIGQVAELPR